MAPTVSMPSTLDGRWGQSPPSLGGDITMSTLHLETLKCVKKQDTVGKVLIDVTEAP